VCRHVSTRVQTSCCRVFIAFEILVPSRSGRLCRSAVGAFWDRAAASISRGTQHSIPTLAWISTAVLVLPVSDNPERHHASIAQDSRPRIPAAACGWRSAGRCPCHDCKSVNVSVAGSNAEFGNHATGRTASCHRRRTDARPVAPPCRCRTCPTRALAWRACSFMGPTPPPGIWFRWLRFRSLKPRGPSCVHESDVDPVDRKLRPAAA